MTAQDPDNPNAIMRSITGDGVTNTLQPQELGISVVADDIYYN